MIGVVDDDNAVRLLLVKYLEANGYEVLESSTAASMLELAQKDRFEAFLIDIEIGKENGIDLCRQIRAIDHHRYTPILIMTGNRDPALIAGAFAAGADDFLEKPLAIASVKSRLQAHILKVDYFIKLERAHQMLKRYLSPHIAAIAKEYSESGVVPGPREREVTVCFTDIRGFTALSETMEPARLFELVSTHLKNQIELVYQYGGYVDKFAGDGLMAVFDGEDMAAQCCLCALEMIRSGNETNDPIPVGMGIHTGTAILGNIGSPSHLDYSVIGASVNLAARLCGYAQPGVIIISDAVRKRISLDPRLTMSHEQSVQIRGFTAPITIHRLGVPVRDQKMILAAS